MLFGVPNLTFQVHRLLVLPSQGFNSGRSERDVRDFHDNDGLHWDGSTGRYLALYLSAIAQPYL